MLRPAEMKPDAGQVDHVALDKAADLVRRRRVAVHSQYAAAALEKYRAAADRAGDAELQRARRR